MVLVLNYPTLLRIIFPRYGQSLSLAPSFPDLSLKCAQFIENVPALNSSAGNVWKYLLTTTLLLTVTLGSLKNKILLGGEGGLQNSHGDVNSIGTIGSNNVVIIVWCLAGTRLIGGITLYAM